MAVFQQAETIHGQPALGALGIQRYLYPGDAFVWPHSTYPLPFPATNLPVHG